MARGLHYAVRGTGLCAGRVPRISRDKRKRFLREAGKPSECAVFFASLAGRFRADRVLL